MKRKKTNIDIHDSIVDMTQSIKDIHQSIERLTVIVIQNSENIATLEKKTDNLKNDIYRFKDEILHEIVDLRDDFAVLTGYRDMIEDHETRIFHIENKKIPIKSA